VVRVFFGMISTMAQRQRTVHIRQFITDLMPSHPKDIVQVVSDQFGMSRQAVHKHLKAMESSGAVKSDGRTSAKVWQLIPVADIEFCLRVTPELEEHEPWVQIIRPALVDVPKNVMDICAYGFTEMLNNVIDHSDSESVRIRCVYTKESVSFRIDDNGVGIFRKIKNEFGLSEEREAILELAKGKVTTDPAHHTGEGVFFTTRMFDLFSMWSGNLFFTHFRPDSDWLIETDKEFRQGTHVSMSVSLKSELEYKDLFDMYAASPDDLTFSKTHVPIKLAQFDTGDLISRSQARRVLSRFDRFNEVILDFTDVDMVGQAFADEIFRVFRLEHPDIKIFATNANEFVAGMVQRAMQAKNEYQLNLFSDEDQDD